MGILITIYSDSSPVLAPQNISRSFSSCSCHGMACLFPLVNKWKLSYVQPGLHCKRWPETMYNSSSFWDSYKLGLDFTLEVELSF